ncbi:MAG: hypothetical protein U0521_02730 [Anaerolineae bacterium]
MRGALAAVGAAALADRQVIELSDGRRQKIMIAQALAQSRPRRSRRADCLPRPTAPRRSHMQVLRRLAHDNQRAILLSTHDLDLALRTADRIWLMTGAGDLRRRAGRFSAEWGIRGGFPGGRRDLRRRPAHFGSSRSRAALPCRATTCPRGGRAARSNAPSSSSAATGRRASRSSRDMAAHRDGVSAEYESLYDLVEAVGKLQD